MHVFGSRSLSHHVKIFYDFETVNVKLYDSKLKLEYLRNKQYLSYTVKTIKHVATIYALVIYY